MKFGLLCLAGIVWLFPGLLEAQLAVTGDVDHPYTLTTAELGALPQRTVTAPEHGGGTSQWQGVDLAELLKKAGVPSGSSLRGGLMTSYLIASGSDGYQVLFSLAELDSAFHDSAVIVAIQHEGKPLSPQEGPLRLIVASDKKPARSVRMLQSLKIVIPGRKKQ